MLTLAGSAGPGPDTHIRGFVGHLPYGFGHTVPADGPQIVDGSGQAVLRELRDFAQGRQRRLSYQYVWGVWTNTHLIKALNESVL